MADPNPRTQIMPDPDAEIAAVECRGFMTTLHLGTVNSSQLNASTVFVFVANTVCGTSQKALPHRRLYMHNIPDKTLCFFTMKLATKN